MVVIQRRFGGDPVPPEVQSPAKATILTPLVVNITLPVAELYVDGIPTPSERTETDAQLPTLRIKVSFRSLTRDDTWDWSTCRQ
jgi:hypothetical protein